jgi:hypothetical protein
MGSLNFMPRGERHYVRHKKTSHPAGRYSFRLMRNRPASFTERQCVERAAAYSRYHGVTVTWPRAKNQTSGRAKVWAEGKHATVVQDGPLFHCQYEPPPYERRAPWG